MAHNLSNPLPPKQQRCFHQLPARRRRLAMGQAYAEMQVAFDSTPNIMEGAGIINEQILQKELEEAKQQIREYEALAQAVRTLARAPADAAPETLAKKLFGAWEEKATEISGLKTQKQNLKWEKVLVEDELKDLVRSVKKVTGLTNSSIGSGDLPYDVMLSWREMQDKNDRLEKQTKEQLQKIVHLEEDSKAIQRNIKICAIAMGVAEDPSKIRTDKLVTKIQTKSAELRREVESHHIERALFESDALKVQALGDELAALKKAQDAVSSGRPRRRFRWFSRRRNKVALALPQQTSQKELEEREAQFRKLFAAQNSRISGLEKDNATLESLLQDLQDSEEAAKTLTRDLEMKTREAEEEKKEAEEEKKEAEDEKRRVEEKAEEEKKEAEEEKRSVEEKAEEDMRRLKEDMEAKIGSLNERTEILDYQNKRQTDRLQQLHELMMRMKGNTVNPHDAMYYVQTAADFAVVTALSSLHCTEIDPHQLRAFDQSASSSLDHIGKGGYGVVFLGRLEGRTKPIAIKKPYIPEDLTEDEAKDEIKESLGRAKKESLVHQLLSDSPFFPGMVGTVESNGDLCIITDFIGDAATGKVHSLLDALYPHAPNGLKIAEWNMASIAVDVVRGVMLMHSKGLIHNDLKPDNILLEEDKQRWHALIIDFGLCSTMGEPLYLKSTQSDKEARRQKTDGAPHVAPEIVLKDERASEASDIYAVGRLLLRIGKLIGNGDLVTIGELYSEEEPHLRPMHIEEILPMVSYIQEILQSDKSALGQKESPV